MKIRKNDEVRIVSGKDKGKTGKVEKVFTKKSQVLIGGINQYKRHQKGRMQGQKSEIITITKPLPMSVVMIVCPKCSKPTRIGYLLRDEKKIRICKKCKQGI